MTKMNDDVARDLITNSLNKNYIVEAGAGSGKTTTLVKRLVKLVEEDPDNISKISCITFTKAAADEFFERFQDLLSKRSHIYKEDNHRPGDLPDPTEKTASNCRQALKNINLCFMGTIDAFVQKLTNEHPYEFKVPAGINVIDEDKQKTYINKIYLEILTGKYDNSIKDNPLSSYCVKALSYLKSSSDFIIGIQYFLKLRSSLPIIEHNIDLTLELDNALLHEKEQLKDVSREINNLIRSLPSPTKAQLELLKASNVPSLCWDKHNQRILKYLDTLKAVHFKNKFIESLPCHANELNLVIDEENNNQYIIQPEFIERIKDGINNFIANYLFKAFYECSKIVSDYIQEKGLFTYSDFIINIRDSLKNDAKSQGKLIKFIQKNRKYYFLDEFQDTNPLQTEIFFYLCSEQLDEDYRKCVLKPGSLFIVGDPKQSIYRFTGADYSMFLRTEELFRKDPTNCEVLLLNKNFRSNVDLRKYFNVQMPQLFSYPYDKVDFPEVPEDVYNDKDNIATLSGVYTYFDEYAKVSDSGTTKSDAHKVGQIIKQLIKNQYTISYTYKDKQQHLLKGVRTLKYEDFMVILPSKKQLNNYLKVFVEMGIPHFIEGGSLFDESEALTEIKQLFNAIVMPNNKSHVYLALLTDYIGLQESDIQQLLLNNIPLSINRNIDNISTLSKDIQDKFNKLVHLYFATKDMSYSAKFLYLIENINLFDRHNYEYLEYVYYAYELIKQEINNGLCKSPEEIIKFVSDISGENAEYERCFNVLSTPGGKVHIANLHKTKGLEAPVVILAAPKKKTSPKKNKYRIERDAENSSVYIFSIDSPINQNASITTSSKYGKESDIKNNKESKYVDEDRSNQSETRRLEYVAATRAKNVLIISKYLYKSTAKNKQDEDPVIKAGFWDDLLKDDYRQIDALLSKDESTANDDNGNVCADYCDKPLMSEESLKPSYKIIRPSKIDGKMDNLRDDDLVSSYGNNIDSTSAAAIGTMVHKLLELIVNSNGLILRYDAISIIVNEFPFLTDENIQMLECVFDIFTRGGFKQKNGSLPQDLLNQIKESKSVMCEVPFAYMKDCNLYNGIMDLVIENQDGSYTIIDYKTNGEDDVKKLEEEYYSQLSNYVQAFKEIVGNDKNVTAKIYHINVQNLLQN